MHDVQKSLRGRSLFVSFNLIFLFSLVIVNYYKIQVIEHEKWVKIADQQHHLVVKEPFQRGKIFLKSENNKRGRPVVMDVLTYHLFIDPMSIKEPLKEEVIAYLEPKLSGKSIKGHFYKKARWRKVADFVNLDEKIEITKWWKAYARKNKMPSNALTFVKDYKRAYPYGHLLGQVLSTVYRNRDEKTGQAVPIGGIEKKYNALLQGAIGKRYLMRSPKYTIDDAKRHIAAKNGSDVYLTINHEVQSICEEELKKGVDKVNAKGGLAVMMDPYTGEIIALAQYPFFEPGKYPSYFANKKSAESVNPKSLTDTFEPGSIMKALTLAIGLKANEKLLDNNMSPLFCPSEMIDCANSSFKGRNRPLKDVSFHKSLNMYLAIQKSSNIYPARIIEKVLESLGPKWYSDQLSEVFGLGNKSGLELPYENAGMIPVYGRKYKNGKQQWSDPTPYSLAIGYNVLVNSVQMARAYSVFANGGYLVEPTLIDKIISPEGEEKRLKKREKKKVLSKDIADIMMTALKYTTKKGGSAYLADIPGYSEGGKTSTTEKLVKGVYSKDTHLSNFIGVAPANSPRFVLIVTVDEPERKYIPGFGTTHFGGKCAAPIFREIGKRSLEALKVPYDDPYGFARNDPRTRQKQSDWWRETKELQAVYDLHNQ